MVNNWQKLDIIKVEHIWHEEDDRWIYICTYTNGSKGFNYMQGYDYDYFLKYACKVDEGLSQFIKENDIDFKPLRQGKTEIDYFSLVFWLYHSAVTCHNMHL